ncbi:MAG: glycosyltransferase, partial [Calditrichaeota bacterium]|nr:glycosyltransferase [Calditrichota bacterium]
MGKKTEILHIIDGLRVGGAEMLLVTLLKNLKGYSLHLIVLGQPVPLAKELPMECKTTYLNFKTYRDIPYSAILVRRYIKKNRIKIVHSHMYWSNITARLATPRKIPVFNCIQNISSLASYKINRLSLYLEKATYRKRHHIIAVSKTVLDDFNQWIGLKGEATVLYNIIGNEFFSNRPPKTFSPDKIRLVAVGNLRKQKNYPYLLSAFKSMPLHVSLDIYGIGPEKEAMQQLIEEDKLNIKLKGIQSNMHLILPEYDAYIMCSTHEGLSLALMEAMACGLPAFLSDIPVQREAAEDAAVYFDLNDPQDCVSKVLDTFINREKLSGMSLKGIERAAEIAKKEKYI